MIDLTTIEERIYYWKSQRLNLEIKHGEFSRVVDRCHSMIGSLRLLRDRIRESGNINVSTFNQTISSREFTLWPFYWERCKEIYNTIIWLIDMNGTEEDKIRFKAEAKL